MANSAQPINKDRLQGESKLHTVTDGLENNGSTVLNNLNSKGRQFLQDAQGKASEFYDISSNWVEENRIITMVGVAALSGLLGFFIGRRISEPTDRTEA